MADLRLPRFLTDKSAESREIAIARFAEENNHVLRQQFQIMSAMQKSIQHIEDMIFLQLDYEKRKIALQQQDTKLAELSELEARRERANEKNASRGSGFGVGGLVSTVAKLGLKGMAAAYLFGFAGELLNWGRDLQETREKWFGDNGYITRIQNGLNDFGDRVQELTGSNVLGGLIRSLIPISAGFAALATVIGPVRTFRLAIAPITFLFNTLGAIAKLDFKALEFAKFLRFAKGFTKFIPLIGEIIIVIEGLIGAIPAAIEGWKRDGWTGALGGFVTGFIHGIADSILGLLQDLEVWFLRQIGFDELASALEGIDITKLVDWCIEGVVNVFKTIGSAIGSFFSAIMNYDYMSLVNKIIDALPVPQIVKDGLKGTVTASTNAARAVAGAVGDTASAAWDMTTAAWDSATGWFGRQRDRIDTAAAGMVRRRTAEMGVGRDRTPARTPARAPIARSTGSMVAGTTAAGRAGAVATGVANGPETSSLGAPGAAGLEDEARRKGMSPQQIAYTYQTDQLIGAPQGATLAQIKQESGFNPNARSPTGAVGLTQFTSIAVKDVLATMRGVSPDKISSEEVQATKASLQGNIDKSLQFHRILMQTIQRRKGTDWLQTMRHYNGDRSLERNGMEARDNYIARISGYLGRGSSVSVAQNDRRASSGAALQTATASVNTAASVSPTIVNAPRTSVTNNNGSARQSSNLSASTPVEFAPHVV